MATTYIRAFDNGDAAGAHASMFRDLGYTIVRLDNTDRVQLDGDNPPSTVWDSGPKTDWTVIVATKSKPLVDGA